MSEANDVLGTHAPHTEVATQTELAGLQSPNSESTATQVAGKSTDGHHPPSSRLRIIKSAIRIAKQHGANGVTVETGGTRIEFYGLRKKDRPHEQTGESHTGKTTPRSSASRPNAKQKCDSRPTHASHEAMAAPARTADADGAMTPRSQASPCEPTHDLSDQPPSPTTARPAPHRVSTPDREAMVMAATGASSPQAREALEVVSGDVKDAINSLQAASATERSSKPARPTVGLSSTSVPKSANASTRGARDSRSRVQPRHEQPAPASDAPAPGPSPNPSQPAEAPTPQSTSKKKSNGKGKGNRKSGQG
jgi:NACalpha-BTF3-like transcription factor